MSRTLPLCLLLLLAFCAGCSKNEFTLEGKIEGGETSTLYMNWRAASGTRDFLAAQAVPLTSTSFKMEGPVKRPAVIWVFSAGRVPLTTIYVERGDRLTLSGKMGEPALWQVEGNDVMEQVSDWVLANETSLKRRDARGINSAISKYVSAHPDTRASLFLLLTRFDRNADKKLYGQLLAKFSDKEMVAEMLAACMEPADAAVETLPVSRMARIEAVLHADSLAADSARSLRPVTEIL